jgi:hypothetical protein
MSEINTTIPLETGAFPVSATFAFDKNIHRDAYLYSFLKKQIEELERYSKDVPDFQREYTSKLRDVLKSNLFVIGKENKLNTNLSVFYAGGERAIVETFQTRNLTLPCISFTVEDIEASLPRRRPDFQVTNYTYFDPIARRAQRVISKAPKAVDLTVRVSVLAKYVEDLAQLVEQVELLFSPFLVLGTSFGNSTHSHLIDWSDESVKVVPSKDERMLVKSCIISVEGYIPQKHYMLTSSGKIQEINFVLKT